MNSNYRLFSSLKCKTLSFIGRNDRQLWTWINTIFNKPDLERIQSVGADRAAAEWVLKNGGSIKWSDSEEWLKDYNLLPNEELVREKKIKEIDGTDSSISYIGFTHLKGLTQLEKMIIKNNGYIEDTAIEMLGICKNSLQHLEIISCIGVTDKGILSLSQLKNLNYLKLFDLPSVEDQEKCLNHLKTGLKCDIDWKTAKPKKLI